MPRRTNLPHIDISNFATADSYTSPSQFPRPRFPERNRAQHADHLLGQMREIQRSIRDPLQQIVGAPGPEGIFLEFESSPDFQLAIKRLDLPSKGIEVLNLRTDEDLIEGVIEKATVFVPDNQISKFISDIEGYRDQLTRTGKPKNRDLVDSISDIRRAVLRSLWTDSLEVFPSPGELVWSSSFNCSLILGKHSSEGVNECLILIKILASDVVKHEVHLLVPPIVLDATLGHQVAIGVSLCGL